MPPSTPPCSLRQAGSSLLPLSAHLGPMESRLAQTWSLRMCFYKGEWLWAHGDVLFLNTSLFFQSVGPAILLLPATFGKESRGKSHHIFKHLYSEMIHITSAHILLSRIAAREAGKWRGTETSTSIHSFFDIYLVRLLWELNIITSLKYLAQCLVDSFLNNYLIFQFNESVSLIGSWWISILLYIYIFLWVWLIQVKVREAASLSEWWWNHVSGSACT